MPPNAPQCSPLPSQAVQPLIQGFKPLEQVNLSSQTQRQNPHPPTTPATHFQPLELHNLPHNNPNLRPLALAHLPLDKVRAPYLAGRVAQQRSQ